jgi:hypothetical protein
MAVIDAFTSSSHSHATHYPVIDKVPANGIDVQSPIGARTVEMNCERCKKMSKAFVGSYKSSFVLLSHQ